MYRFAAMVAIAVTAAATASPLAAQPVRTPITAAQMLEAANAVVPRITPAQAAEMIAKGNTVVIDVREPGELNAGKVAGAINIPRGMLEFQVDPQSPRFHGNLALDKNVILYCASGGRAALAGKTLKEMGYSNVYNVGGFKNWADSGGAVEQP